MKNATNYIVLDIESTGLNWTDEVMHGVGVGYPDGRVEYYPSWNIPVELRQLLADPTVNKVGHNFHSFDAKFLRRFGLEIQGEFEDTMVLANLIDADQPLGLKYLADKYLGSTSLEQKRVLDEYCKAAGVKAVDGLCAKDLADPTRPHLEMIAKYCKEDVYNTWTLFLAFKAELAAIDEDMKRNGFKKSPLDYYYEEALPLERVLFEMEYKGIRIDVTAISAIRDNANDELKKIETALNASLGKGISLVEDDLVAKEQAKVASEAAKAKRVKGQGNCKFQWTNGNHVGRLFAKHPVLQYHLVKTKTGKIRTDKEAMSILLTKSTGPEAKAINKILRYKLLCKIISTYTGNNSKGIFSKIRYVTATGEIYRMQVDNSIPKIFPKYRQTTGTGRLACSEPNTQNLKRDSEIKKIFIPDNEDEVFIDADYSQIELRVAAHVSRDPALVNAYVSGDDVHLLTATRLFGREITKKDDVERQAGKRTNFLTIFDGKSFRLQASLKADTGKDFTLEECDTFIAKWFEAYPDYKQYLDTQVAAFRKTRYVSTETGRKRLLPDIAVKDCFEFKSGLPVFVGKPEVKAYLIEQFKKVTKTELPWIDDKALYFKVATKLFNHAVKAGYNQPIQGLAASMTKRAMISLYRMGILPTNQVHDSLTIARKRSDLDIEAKVIAAMKSYSLSVPIEIDIKTLRSFHPSDKI